MGIAEHLGLRSRDELLAAFDAAGLKVAGGRTSVRIIQGRRRHRPAPRCARRGADIALAPRGALTV